MNKKSSLLIENKSQLIQYLTDGIKKDNHLRIGVEHEKFIFNKDNFKRIDYDQIKNVFEILKNKGWEPQLEKNKLIGLKRKNQKITTEPGFQYELSGAPFKNIHSVCSENSNHFNELKEIFKSDFPACFKSASINALYLSISVIISSPSLYCISGERELK